MKYRQTDTLRWVAGLIPLLFPFPLAARRSFVVRGSYLAAWAHPVGAAGS